MPRTVFRLPRHMLAAACFLAVISGPARAGITITGANSTLGAGGVGQLGGGAMRIDGGSTLTNTGFTIGVYSSGGVMTLTDAGSSWIVGDLSIGWTQSGEVDVLGGATLSTTGSNTVGDFGVFNLSGSVADGVITRWNSTGTINASGGPITIGAGGMVTQSGTTSAGAAVGDTGTIAVTGPVGDGSPGWSSSGTMTIGTRGTGNFNVSGGGSAVSSSSTTTFGYYGGAIGALNVSGALSSFSISGMYTYYGYSGNAEIRVTGGGTLNNTGTFVLLAYGAGSNVDALVDGAGSTWNVTNTLGHYGAGTGSIGVSDGGTINAGTLILGTGRSLSVAGAGSKLAVNSLYTGSSMNVSTGAKVTTGNTYVGYTSGANSRVTLHDAGTVWSAVGDFNLAAGSMGVLVVYDGAELNVSAAGSAAGTGDGTITLGSAGTAKAILNIGDVIGNDLTDAGVVRAALITTGAGTGVKTVNFNHTGAIDFTPRLAGSLLVVQAAGVTTLNTTNTYTGTTNISGGTLVVNGAIGTGAVTVAQDAVLAGSGVVGGNVSIASGGHLAAAPAGSALRIGGGLTLASGSVIDLVLGASSGGIRVTSGVVSGTAVNVNITVADGFAGGLYTLIDATGATVSGLETNSFVLDGSIDGYDLAVVRDGDVFSVAATAVPEPAAYGVTVASLAATFAFLRRRKTARPDPTR